EENHGPAPRHPARCRARAPAQRPRRDRRRGRRHHGGAHGPGRVLPAQHRRDHAQRRGRRPPPPDHPRPPGPAAAALRRPADPPASVEDAGSTFVITGDIPAMWLRDSAAQLTPLLRLVSAEVGPERDRAQLVSLLSGLLRRHWHYLAIDPYANAFNRTPD